MDLFYLFTSYIARFISCSFFLPLVALFSVGLCFCIVFKIVRSKYD